MADEREYPSAGEAEVGQSTIEDRSVVEGIETASDQILDRPVVARSNQPTGDSAQQRFVVATQGGNEAIGPGDWRTS
jgi:hypothetical protein